MMTEKKFQRPRSLKDTKTHYCPGCGHGIVHRIVAEIIDELNIREKVIAVAPVGCSVLAYDYWDFDCTEAAHGRALAVATGIKRYKPESVVFTYQGDGDLASIGAAETLHAANRGENLTCIFINNAIYGMTGGQMAPTTLINQKTTTTPLGRDIEEHGPPLRITELLASLPRVVYAERTAVFNPGKVIKTKQAIKQAFTNQIEKKGFSIVEVLSQCPVVWRKPPFEAVKWVEQEMSRVFPLGRIK
jgi:2-oxoglutarate/2-oxoacid ferredoxin oxidoreductase subunit beta